MDTCSILLDISLKPSVKLLMPHQIRLFGAPCEIWWHDSPEFCRYCKLTGHKIGSCPKLRHNKGKQPPYIRPYQETGNSLRSLPLATTSASTLEVLLDLPDLGNEEFTEETEAFLQYLDQPMEGSTAVSGDTLPPPPEDSIMGIAPPLSLTAPSSPPPPTLPPPSPPSPSSSSPPSSPP